MNRSASPRELAPRLLVGAAFALVAGLVLLAGCKKSMPPISSGDQFGQTGDPWGDLGRQLQKGTDAAAAKSALTHLNNALSAGGSVPIPPLGADAEKALAVTLRLSSADLDELRPTSFTALDQTYLADAFYFRDAARSLEIRGTPSIHHAETAFAWVCRQVYLNPWPVPMPGSGGLQASALPPTAVLRRGSGSGLERAYVFLALLQQAGIDAGLVGPPDAGDQYAGFIPRGPDGKTLPGFPRGPFWAVAVRIGPDVLLFDPWRGVPFPGPDGKGVGTLAQLKANPDQIKSWLDDKNWGVTADDVKTAKVYLSVPLSGLSNRMKVLEEKLPADVGVKLATHTIALRERFLKPPPDGPGLAADGVAFWRSAADDRFAYVRTLPSFLPPEEGGRDREPLGTRLHTLYMRSMFPRSVVILRPNLDPQLVNRLQNASASLYSAAFLQPPMPRESLQRGQFQEANKVLTSKQTDFSKGLERLAQARAVPQNATVINEWFERGNSLYKQLDLVTNPIPTAPPRPDSDPEVAQAKAAVEQFWRESGQVAQLIVDQASSEAGLTEAGYLLALSKHEEAERAQTRAERATGPEAARAKADAAEAWREAANAWQSYETRAARTLGGWPGRAGHVRVLAARAVQLAP
jgi:hypothetical protein